MSEEMESSSFVGHFRAPKVNSFSEPPLKELVFAGFIQILGTLVFTLRVSHLFLKLGRADISLCKCRSSAFIKLTVWGKILPAHGMCQREKKGREGRVRLSRWDYT